LKNTFYIQFEIICSVNVATKVKVLKQYTALANDTLIAAVISSYYSENSISFEVNIE